MKWPWSKKEEVKPKVNRGFCKDCKHLKDSEFPALPEDEWECIHPSCVEEDVNLLTGKSTVAGMPCEDERAGMAPDYCGEFGQNFEKMVLSSSAKHI